MHRLDSITLIRDLAKKRSCCGFQRRCVAKYRKGYFVLLTNTLGRRRPSRIAHAAQRRVQSYTFDSRFCLQAYQNTGWPCVVANPLKLTVKGVLSFLGSMQSYRCTAGSALG